MKFTEDKNRQMQEGVKDKTNRITGMTAIFYFLLIFHFSILPLKNNRIMPVILSLSFGLLSAISNVRAVSTFGFSRSIFNKPVFCNIVSYLFYLLLLIEFIGN
jgi:hypothetical protein